MGLIEIDKSEWGIHCQVASLNGQWSL